MSLLCSDVLSFFKKRGYICTYSVNRGVNYFDVRRKDGVRLFDLILIDGELYLESLVGAPLGFDVVNLALDSIMFVKERGGVDV